jgi:hypothetical protein
MAEVKPESKAGRRWGETDALQTPLGARNPLTCGKESSNFLGKHGSTCANAVDTQVTALLDGERGLKTGWIAGVLA